MTLLSLSALALTACATSTPINTQPDQLDVVYKCEDGTILNVSFVERGYTTIHGGKHYKRRYHEKAPAAIVNVGDNQTVTLIQEVSGSGFIYSNERYSLHSKGNEAIWTVGKMAGEHCTLN